MRIINHDNAKKVPFDLDGKIMFQSAEFEVIHLTLKEGEILAKHNNPFDVVFYVLEGTGVFYLEEKEYEISANSCFEVLCGNLRGWENKSNQPLKLLVMKRINQKM